MRLRNLVAGLAVLSSLILTTHANAGTLVVSIDDNLGLNVGQGGTVSVYGEAVGGDVPLNFFNYQIRIGLVSGSGRFEITPPSSTDLSNLNSDSSYVFSGIGSPTASVSGVVVPNDTITGGDLRPDFDNTIIAEGPQNKVLLARFSFTAASGSLAPVAGSIFSVDLIPDSLAASDQPDDSPPGNTYFYYHQPSTSPDDFGHDLANGFRSSSGTITVRGAVATPEPGTILGALLGSCLLGLSTRIRRPAR